MTSPIRATSTRPSTASTPWCTWPVSRPRRPGRSSATRTSTACSTCSRRPGGTACSGSSSRRPTTPSASPRWPTSFAADTPPRPDTLYGVSKVFGEALGRYYVDRYGLQVSCLRIGTCDWTPGDRRALATWLSPDDCARLVDAALRTRVAYSVVWGVSANTRRWWSLEAGRAIGYEPLDDAEAFASIAAARARPTRPITLVGGGFTTAGFGIDEVRLAMITSRTAGTRSSAWIADDVDPAAAAELQALLDLPAMIRAELADRFSGPLTFGTAGCAGRCAPAPTA